MSAPPPPAERVVSAGKAGDISLRLTQDAQQQTFGNGKFNQTRLLATLRRALERNDILTKETDPALPTIEITISDVHTRSSFVAIRFGWPADDDHIEGDVVVRTPSGTASTQFSVSASYAAGFPAGDKNAPIDWLYESFARRVLQGLKGPASL